MTLRRAHAAAPARLDLAGAWTDVPPFSAREGGMVVSAAINLKVHVNVLPDGDALQLIAEDLGVREALADAMPVRMSRVPLLAGSARRFGVHDATIISRSDAPPGSGLGTSGALGVAAVAALHHARQDTVMPLACARTAWEIETHDVGNAGGRQDQWMAALGGFQFLSFRDPDVTSRPVALDSAFADLLAEATVLCYTGVSRVSGGTIVRVMSAYERQDAHVTAALRGLRDVAAEMESALVSGDLLAVGRLLAANWVLQRALDPAMRTPEMAALESAVAAAGAIGGKAAGSGAGGCMFFLAPGCRDRVARAATAAGASVLPVRWSWEGVTTW